MTKRVLLALCALGVLSASCGGGSPAQGKAVASAASIAPSPAPSPSPSPTLLDVDPLTGEAPRPTGSVVVVKVDNAGLSRQYQRGLGRAAIVYEEIVEAGETRFAAVFTTAPSGEVGPVRSVRESDIELLRQYGGVPVAFSGGNTGVKATFHAAVRKGYLLDASYDVIPQDYRLGERRADARNFFTSPAALASSRPGAPAHDVGLRFGPLPVGGGPAVGVAKAVFSAFVTVRTQYVPETGRWAVFQNAHEMRDVAPANVIIQRVPIRMSRYVDVLGNRTPYTVTTGTGPVTVLRDGVALTGTWQRRTASDGTRFVDALGSDIPLRPGPTWVLLLPTTSSLTLG
ncbi:MAG: DUF3048 domain-containing protein [Frankiaceae bacterium]|nr:DUF3048 domain-containing protein [Frankiaceae bacterium]